MKTFIDIEAGGFKPGEFGIMMGRRTGKSTLNQMFKVLAQPPIKVLDTATVDGVQWYTISCLRDTSIWIRENYEDQENKTWFQNIDEKWHINFNVFDVHEELYTLLVLRWA
jgi:hypothetical protein